MPSAILNVTFDCHDAQLVAEFWSAVTGYALEHVPDAGNPCWVAGGPATALPRLVFVTVSERKSLKNRVHLDVMPEDRDQAGEVDRLLQLGATVVDDRRQLTPGGWVVMADPEGNEFCVE